MATGKRGWIFLAGVRETANEAADAARRMMTLFAEHRLFVYEPYLAILNEGTEPIR